MAQRPDIVFDHVSFAYREGQSVLRDISLTIPAGQFVAVLGANGSGKSTLAMHINALLRPTAGEVRVGGLSTSDPTNAHAIRTNASMVFQNPDSQAVASLVRDDVAFGPENLGVDPVDIRQRVERALASVGMLEHADAEIHSLSGGQKQRVAIAGALAMQPDILVLDEPGAMLDVCGRRDVMRIVHELNAAGMTIVHITHFMEEALEAQRVVVLDQGAIALDGAPADVFADTGRLEELRLELPFPLRLAHELRARGVQVDGGIDERELQRELCALHAARTKAACSSDLPGERTPA